MFRVPEELRLLRSKTDVTLRGSTWGHFLLQGTGTRKLHCIASDGAGWQHVSVSVYGREEKAVPNWEEMCRVKAAFWEPEDVAVEFHPRASEYVNNRAGVLHLWRPIGVVIPTPPPELVGKPGAESVPLDEGRAWKRSLDLDEEERRGYQRLVDQLDRDQWGNLRRAVMLRLATENAPRGKRPCTSCVRASDGLSLPLKCDACRSTGWIDARSEACPRGCPITSADSRTPSGRDVCGTCGTIV